MMSKVEVILQLLSLRERCKEFKKTLCDDAESIWNDDIKVIDIAIKTIAQSEADGCMNCVFEGVEEWELPCRQCARGCKDYWRRIGRSTAD